MSEEGKSTLSVTNVASVMKRTFTDISAKTSNSSGCSSPEEANMDEKLVQQEEKTAKNMKQGIKRKQRTENTEENEAGPSNGSAPHQKKSATLLKQGKKEQIMCFNELPVTCGNKKGILRKDRLARGKKCILSEECWFTPGDFEKFAGKGTSKNWKLSIRYEDCALKTLIEEGHLKTSSAKKPGVPKDQNLTYISTDSSISGLDRIDYLSSDDDQDIEGKEKIRAKEEVEENRDPVDLSLFTPPSLPVSCGSASGILCKSRFTGPHSKSIRTEERWFTPEEFANQDSTLMNAYWRKDILCHGKTLYYLVKKEILDVHSKQCLCNYCYQKEPNNDDFCFICNDYGDLVCCDACPRAFHQNCHLPKLWKETLGDKWTCTFCMINEDEVPRLSMIKEDTLPLSKAIMYCEYLLLCLYKEDKKQVFTEGPTSSHSGRMESGFYTVLNIFSHFGSMSFDNSRQMDIKNETSSIGLPDNFSDQLQDHDQNVTDNSQSEDGPSTSRPQLGTDLYKAKQIAKWELQMELIKLQTKQTMLTTEILEYKLKGIKKSCENREIKSVNS